MRWIVLTGVNGFIGHNLLLQFLESSPGTLVPPVDLVVGADLRSSLDRQTHRRTKDNAGYRFVPAENLLEQLARLEQEFGGPPLAIIHNGACSSTTETDPEVFRTLNVESSQQLFDYCATKSLPFLYASSASVYGDGTLGFCDDISLNHQFTPMNLYGRSKHTFDSWVLEQEQKPSAWFGMRYFNVFGSFETHKKSQASILHWGRKQINESGTLRLYKSHQPDLADGHQKRDFVGVQDICRVTLRLLNLALEGVNLPHGGKFVNVGRGEAATWIELAEALFSALDRPPRLEFIPMPESLQAHYQNYTKAELTGLGELGIVEPFMGLAQAMRDSIQREQEADYGLNTVS